MLPLYPLRFREVIRNYPFGGRRIPARFPAKDGLPGEGTLAETWEVSDHGPDQSVVRGGPLEGCTLRRLVEEMGEGLLGTRVARECPGKFPLLLKFLDAQRLLPPQVHPTDGYAALHEPGEMGKTEAWYILEARRGARLYCGNARGLTLERFRDLVARGRSTDTMEAVEVKAGDTLYAPAGTLHAIGPGILLFEAQQNSDVTYNFDWLEWPHTPRQAREHLRKCFDVTVFEDVPSRRIEPVSVQENGNTRTVLMACRRFAMERWDLRDRKHVEAHPERFVVLTCLEGRGSVVYGSPRGAGGLLSEGFEAGQTVLVPAALGGWQVRRDRGVGRPRGDSGRAGLSVLVTYVPDLRRDIVEPLEKARVSGERIAGLGGHGRGNDLRGLV